MVAHPASRLGGFTPLELPRVAVAADGTVATIHEASRVTILEIPSGAAFAEIGVDPEAAASEVAWLGTPPRLLVLSRYAAHSTAHLLDPFGPRTISEIRLESPMRLYATVGAAALVVGGLGAAVLVAGESHLTPYQFPTRAVPIAAGAAANQFVVALAGSIEEWDPQSRMPKRRLRLPRVAAITAVGGSERVVWMTTQQDPARIDVIPLINRGQPKAHDLPEAIASIAGQPRSDLVACVGAETGRLYVVDLDGRTRLRSFDPDGLDRIDSIGLIAGRMFAVLAAQANRPIAIVPVDGREIGAEPSAGSSTTGVTARDDAPADPAAPSAPPAPGSERASAGPRAPASPAGPPSSSSSLTGPSSSLSSPSSPSAPSPSSTSVPSRPSLPSSSFSYSPSASSVPASSSSSSLPSSPPSSPTPSSSSPSPSSFPFGTPAARPAAPAASRAGLFRSPARSAPAKPAATVAAAPPVAPVNERFSAWRDVLRHNQASPDPATAMRGDTIPAHGDARLSWRDEIVAWTRAVASGAADHGAPSAPAIDAVVARFELPMALQPVLALLYGAHLCGERGAAPAEVARLLDHQWDEALGRGDLADRGVAIYAGSRVALSPLVLRALDELPPVTGTLVGEPGAVALLGPCVVVAGDEPLTAIAEHCLARVNGAILAAHGDAERRALLFEARARGAAAMLRASLAAPPTDAAIFVIEDAELAERLGLPRLA